MSRMFERTWVSTALALLVAAVMGVGCAQQDASTPKKKPKAEEPAPAARAPETAPSELPIPETPTPELPAPETPLSETPLPETPLPEPSLPETPTFETPVPETPEPEPETPSHEMPVPITPEPEPETPSHEMPVPMLPEPEPETPSHEMPVPMTPEPEAETPSHEMPVPMTPEPEPVPETPLPETPEPESVPEPVPEPVAEPVPETPTPDTPASEEAGTEQPKPLAESKLLVTLPPDLCNTPDGMCLLPDGNVILSVPNCNDASQPPLLMKITPQNQTELFYKLPPHPDTGKPFGPLGICVAPSGDLYLADWQPEPKNHSRVVRIVIKDGRPAECVTVAKGFGVSNAVILRDGYLYVSDTQIDATVKPSVSGVFRFKLGEEGVELKVPGSDDPHLIATIECHDEELPLGADGLAFDKQGNLYIGNFADGTVHKLQFDAEGKVAANKIFAQADFMKSADGLFFDPVAEKIYVADSRANAVQIVSLDGTVSTLAQNGDTDGTDGGMDQPCEVLLRGRELIVSNMDWPVPGCINPKYDKPCTLSVIKLD